LDISGQKIQPQVVKNQDSLLTVQKALDIVDDLLLLGIVATNETSVIPQSELV